MGPRQKASPRPRPLSTNAEPRISSLPPRDNRHLSTTLLKHSLQFLLNASIMAAPVLNSSMQPTDVYGGGTKLPNPSPFHPANTSQTKSPPSSSTQATPVCALASQEKTHRNPSSTRIMAQPPMDASSLATMQSTTRGPVSKSEIPCQKKA